MQIEAKLQMDSTEMGIETSDPQIEGRLVVSEHEASDDTSLARPIAGLFRL